MDDDRIRQLLDLMNEYELNEMEVEVGDDYFRFSRGKPEHAAVPQPVMIPQMVPPTGVAPAMPAETTETETTSGMLEIRAPMVGTFYRAPSPEDEPFVEVGDHVTPDTTVCIIEAMKVMNEIKAEVTGTVSKIVMEDARPVEFGQVIFLVDPD